MFPSRILCFVLHFKLGFVSQTFPIDIPQTCLSLRCVPLLLFAPGRLNLCGARQACRPGLSIVSQCNFRQVLPTQRLSHQRRAFPMTTVHYNMTSKLYFCPLTSDSSLLLPVRCFLCVRWILLVICMHCTVSCFPIRPFFFH